MARSRYKQFIAAIIAAATTATLVQVVYSAPTTNLGTTASPTPALPPLPQGDQLVHLLKKISDEALLLEPERMAKELDIPMTFETKPSRYRSKPCEEGGDQKSSLVTTATVAASWYKETPEGIPDMKIPPAFINPAAAAGKPEVHYDAYRTIRCKSPSYTHIESRLSFGNLSGFSCLTPERLHKLIGAEYDLATDGVALSSYWPPPTYAYGVVLRFTFRAGAPCAVAASIEQDSRTGLREKRAFLKWRACYDNARRAFCEAHGWKATHDQLSRHGAAACADREVYIEREPVEGDSMIVWPTFPPMSDNPCNDFPTTKQ